VGKFELGARLDGDDQGGPTRHAHQEAMAERSIALPPDVVARARIVIWTEADKSSRFGENISQLICELTR